MEAIEEDQSAKMDPPCSPSGCNPPEPPLSKNARKKLLKQQRYEAKKAEKKAQEKELKKKDIERKRKEWEETLASVTEEERAKLIESRKSLRKERMGKRSEEKEKKIERLNRAKDCGQKIVIDLEFSDLMTPSEIHSLVQQVCSLVTHFIWLINYYLWWCEYWIVFLYFRGLVNVSSSRWNVEHLRDEIDCFLEDHTFEMKGFFYEVP